tara:strand:- start:1078 stop:1536 length:459 start_codon:yes stop_codon:yes gene_type:complete
MTLLLKSRAGVVVKCKVDTLDYYLCVLADENGKWGFPKGHIERGETSINCAIRECYEETGIQVNPTNLVVFTGKYTNYYYYETVNIIEPKPQDLNEIRQVKWFSVIELNGTNREMFNHDMREYINIFLSENEEGFKTVINKKKPKPRKRIDN